MKINAIAFPGNSFSACAGPGTKTQFTTDDYEFDWPYLVAQYFNAEITCTGIPGVNFYHGVQSLFGIDSHYTSNKTFDETDLVIFTVSNPVISIINRDRIAMYYYWAGEVAKGNHLPAVLSEDEMNRHRKEPFTKEEIIKNATIVKDYLDNIVDWRSLEVLQHAFIMFVDEKLISMKKKAIWLPASTIADRDIPGWCGRWEPKSGPKGNIPFREISAAEGKSLTADDDRRNHLSPEGNKAFAEMLIDTIERDPELKPGMLDMKPWYPDVDESKWQQIDHGSDRPQRALNSGYPPDYPFLIPGGQL